MSSHFISRRNLLISTAVTMGGCWKHSDAQAVAPGPGAAQSLDEIDGFVAEQMGRYQIPGLSLAILRSGKTTLARSYGFNDVEFGIKANNQTVYQLASVTKIFTSVGVMLLVDDNKLVLETRVTELLPNLPGSWSNVRVRHLLSHTSGLPSNLGSNPRYQAEERLRRERERFVDADKLDYFTAAERLSYLTELPLEFPAGAKWSYNQPGYMLLGIVVEHLSGQPFPAFMRQQLFSKLAMDSARFGDSRVVVSGRRQVAYTRQYGPLQNWLWPYSTWDYPAAGLNVSVLDLAKFFTALTTGKLLRQATIESMWEQVQLESGKKINYAQGWTVGEIAGRKTVGHEGGGCAWVSHVPSASLTLIVLTNLAGSGADLGDKLASQLLQG